MTDTHALPELETERLVLRGAVAGDMKTLQVHWNEPSVRRYLFDDNPVDEALAGSVLTACLESAALGHGLWILTRKSARQFVGCAALVPTTVAAEYEPRLAGLLEPMVSLVPSSWGRGLATEALSAVLGHAFRTLALPSLAAVNDLPNKASERMLLRCGFKASSEVQGPRYRLRTYHLERGAWLGDA